MPSTSRRGRGSPRSWPARCSRRCSSSDGSRSAVGVATRLDVHGAGAARGCGVPGRSRLRVRRRVAAVRTGQRRPDRRTAGPRIAAHRPVDGAVRRARADQLRRLPLPLAGVRAPRRHPDRPRPLAVGRVAPGGDARRSRSLSFHLLERPIRERRLLVRRTAVHRLPSAPLPSASQPSPSSRCSKPTETDAFERHRRRGHARTRGLAGAARAPELVASERLVGPDCGNGDCAVRHVSSDHGHRVDGAARSADRTPAASDQVVPATSSPSPSSTPATAGPRTPGQGRRPHPPPHPPPPTRRRSCRRRPVRMLVIGDSTAQALGNGIAAWAQERPDLAEVEVMAFPGCGLLLGGERRFDGDWLAVPDGCATLFDVDVTARDRTRRNPTSSWSSRRSGTSPIIDGPTTATPPARRSTTCSPLVCCDRFGTYNETLARHVGGTGRVGAVPRPSTTSGRTQTSRPTTLRATTSSPRRSERPHRSIPHGVRVVELSEWISAEGLDADRTARPDGVHLTLAAATAATRTWLGQQLIEAALR